MSKPTPKANAPAKIVDTYTPRRMDDERGKWKVIEQYTRTTLTVALDEGVVEGGGELLALSKSILW